jgi:hypothetical protein
MAISTVSGHESRPAACVARKGHALRAAASKKRSRVTATSGTPARAASPGRLHRLVVVARRRLARMAPTTSRIAKAGGWRLSQSSQARRLSGFTV